MSVPQCEFYLVDKKKSITTKWKENETCFCTHSIKLIFLKNQFLLHSQQQTFSAISLPSLHIERPKLVFFAKHLKRSQRNQVFMKSDVLVRFSIASSECISEQHCHALILTIIV